ncbi:MAG: hypothetical protein EOP60_08950 [Sphingomonadales bacterium]|nr:MAG: hypothetical protein EOP60_08950 [Sphingomonadales bacterium]
MPGILSSIFESESADGQDSAEGPSENMGQAYVSPDDNFDEDGEGSQGTQSFSPGASENPNDGGAGDVGGPAGPPTNIYLEDQGDASGF